MVMDHGKTRQETSEESTSFLNNLQKLLVEIFCFWVMGSSKCLYLKVERRESDFLDARIISLCFSCETL
jgi:hypothetical protein